MTCHRFHFYHYTRKANRDLIERSFGGTDFLKDLLLPLRNFVASYPESFACGKAP